jgi:hypothetical protein
MKGLCLASRLRSGASIRELLIFTTAAQKLNQGTLPERQPDSGTDGGCYRSGCPFLLTFLGKLVRWRSRASKKVREAFSAK